MPRPIPRLPPQQPPLFSGGNPSFFAALKSPAVLGFGVSVFGFLVSVHVIAFMRFEVGDMEECVSNEGASITSCNADHHMVIALNHAADDQ
jgi:hypothetical protein